MKREQADLWERWEQGHKIVVTTNVGWDPRTRRNNMGAGLALQAARRWPWLPEWYGDFCRRSVMGRQTPTRTVPVLEHDQLRLIFLPVKPLLHYADPERSWDQPARLDVIRTGLARLTRHHGTIALAYPGCGNGGLKPSQVRPLLEMFLVEDRFTVCDWEFPLQAGDYRTGVNAAVAGLGMLDDALQSAGLRVRGGQIERA